SGINGKNQLEAALKGADSAVILKSYKNIRDIAATVEHVGRRGEAVFASRLGLEDEHIAKGPDAIPDKAPYLSLLLLPPRREDEDISHNITE
ncbi:precorrin-2 C(20)-methyltransferase, partial [Desulfovibrio sp. OttesenSCG-928-M14]|nr:precorrin-2 C(20)-methyltransferase [Desulfovibrio sp. OttesenSCG-928-M14]